MSIDQEIRENSKSPSEHRSGNDDDVVVNSTTSSRDASTSRSQSPASCVSEPESLQNSAEEVTSNKPVRPTDLNLRHRKKLKSAERLATKSISSSTLVFDQAKKQKVPAINRALNADPVDINTIRRLAIGKAGLVNDSLRRKAWPKLLNVNVFDIISKPSQKKMKSHFYYNQVVLDVNRSLKRFPPGMKDDQRSVLQDQLVDVIMRILVKHRDLHYYQGYHDICVTFLLVVGEDITFALIDKLSTNHLRDFMDKTMDRTNHMLNYLYPIIGRASPPLRHHMESAELGTIFCLPWLITWYGHVMGDFRHVVRLYDFFLACHPLMPIYLAAALILYREEEVLSSDCDMPTLHCLLSKIPADLPWERLISNAGDLYVQYPPSELALEARLHYKESSSITNYNQFIKTTHDQRPDSVLKQSAILESQNKKKQNGVLQSSVMKYSACALLSGLAAAASAVLYTAMDLEWF